MKSNMKKLAALLLSVLMIVAISIPSFAAAADAKSDITFNIKGKNLTSASDINNINAMAADNPYSVSVTTGATVEQAIKDLASSGDRSWTCIFTTYSSNDALTNLNDLAQQDIYGTNSWTGKYWNIGFKSSTTPVLVSGPDLELSANTQYDLPVYANNAVVGQAQQLTFINYDEDGNAVESVYSNITIDEIVLTYTEDSFTW